MKGVWLASAAWVLLSVTGANGAQQAAAPAEGTTGPFGWMTLPKVTLPKLTMPKVEMPKMPADPLAPFRTGAQKVTDGTKKAWEGTKELFTVGGGRAPSAPKTDQPPWWKRMFRTEEAPPKEGPQTVAEWMSQPRLEH